MPIIMSIHKIERFFNQEVTVLDWRTIPRNNDFFLKMGKSYITIGWIMSLQVTPNTFKIAFIVTNEIAANNTLHQIWNAGKKFFFDEKLA